MMNVADCDLSRVDAHLSGVDVDLPGIYLWPAVVVEYVRDARGWRRRRHHLMEVLHDFLDGRDGLTNPRHRLLRYPVRALYLGPSQGHLVQLRLHLHSCSVVILLRRSL